MRGTGAQVSLAPVIASVLLVIAVAGWTSFIVACTRSGATQPRPRWGTGRRWRVAPLLIAQVCTVLGADQLRHEYGRWAFYAATAVVLVPAGVIALVVFLRTPPIVTTSEEKDRSEGGSGAPGRAGHRPRQS